jgi:hypothetical protein
MKNENKALRAAWMKHLAEMKSSGMSGKAWCAHEGISYHKYRYWRDRIGSPGKIAAQATPTWVELSPAAVVPIPASSDALVVRIGEVVVELRLGFDPELLREIVRALASA